MTAARLRAHVAHTCVDLDARVVYREIVRTPIFELQQNRAAPSKASCSCVHVRAGTRLGAQVSNARMAACQYAELCQLCTRQRLVPKWWWLPRALLHPPAIAVGLLCAARPGRPRSARLRSPRFPARTCHRTARPRRTRSLRRRAPPYGHPRSDRRPAHDITSSAARDSDMR